MNPSSAPTGDMLNDAGRWFLSFVDVRWILILAALFAFGFWLAVFFIQKRRMSADDVIALGQAVISLYGAPVLFCLLVLSDPPLFEPQKKYLYQSAGFIASLILIFSFVKQIWKAWINSGSTNNVSASASPGAKEPTS
jgi:hypothetical protein